MQSKYLAGLLAAGLLLNGVLASAAPITVENAFYFRENRGANDVGATAGDRLVFGAGSVVPNAAGGTVATRAFGSGAPVALPPNGSTVNPNQFSGSTNYTLARALAPINLIFTNGLDTTSVSLGAIGNIGLMPLAFDLGVSGTGTALTFNWTDPVIPAGLALERAQIRLYDLDNIDAQGDADLIHSAFLTSSTDTSYALPALLSTGLSLQFEHHYAFGIRLEDLRDGVDPTLAGPARLSSSQAYFSFMTSAPVSEPGIHALMAFGLAMIGWVGRRKKPKDRAAN